MSGVFLAWDKRFPLGPVCLRPRGCRKAPENGPRRLEKTQCELKSARNPLNDIKNGWNYGNEPLFHQLELRQLAVLRLGELALAGQPSQSAVDLVG